MNDAKKKEPDSPNDLPLIQRPYASRQLLVVVDDTVVDKESRRPAAKEAKGEDATKLALSFAAGLAGVIAPFPFSLLVPAVAALAKALTRLREQGVDVLVVTQSEAANLIFPPGHPRHEVLYVGHPADAKVYFTIAQFHRMTFEHKFSEAVQLLMALGAKTLQVEHIAGWSSEFSSKLAISLPVPETEVGGHAGQSKKASRQLLFAATLDGTATPAIPDGLVWYHHEPTWQRIAEGRLKYGLKDFTLSVTYEDDFGINAGLKLKADRVGLELGGQFEDHQNTIWRLVGSFA